MQGVVEISLLGSERARTGNRPGYSPLICLWAVDVWPLVFHRGIMISWLLLVLRTLAGIA